MVSLYGNSAPKQISIAEIKQVKKRIPIGKAAAPVEAPVPTVADLVDAGMEPPVAKKQKTEKQIAATEARRVAAAEKKEALAKEKLAAAELAAAVQKAKEDQAAAKKALAAEKRRAKKEEKEQQEASPQSSPPPPGEVKQEKHVNMQKMVESALKSKHANDGEKVAQKAVRFEAAQMVQEAMADPAIRAKVEKTQITSEQRLLRLMFPGRRF